jgi:alkylation response protein AidB-like acyl-CoA dehydrogenase
MDAEAYRLFTWQTVAKLDGGGSIGAEASVNKVFWSEMDVRLHETAMRLLGPQAELDDEPWTKGFQFSLAGPIYAGTNEIQRNVIAERLLGLPRS